jgi:hypothetical protein
MTPPSCVVFLELNFFESIAREKFQSLAIIFKHTISLSRFVVKWHQERFSIKKITLKYDKVIQQMLNKILKSFLRNGISVC